MNDTTTPGPERDTAIQDMISEHREHLRNRVRKKAGMNEYVYWHDVSWAFTRMYHLSAPPRTGNEEDLDGVNIEVNIHNPENSAPSEKKNDLAEMLEEAQENQTCMSLRVDQDSTSVDLILDTSMNTYGEWIVGEGADICLYRNRDTKKVVGCHLPLYDEKLVVSHAGPIRINAGFKKGDQK